MPCRDYESDWPVRFDIPSQEEKIDQLAKMLCESQKLLAEWAVPDKVKSEELREWWQRHQESDRLAKAELKEEKMLKKLRIKALEKLTDDEIESLDLSDEVMKGV